MPVLAAAYGTLTVTNTTTPVLTIDLEVTDTGGPEIELTVTGAAAVAYAQRFQRFGVAAEYDRSDGVMVPFRDREIGAEVTIDESVDSYGDRLTMQLVGERFSPFRAFARMKRKISVAFWYGSPSAEYLADVFTGWIVEGPYEVHPPSLRITCLDAAGLYTEKRAKDWSLPPNSQRTRLSVTLELLALGGIPVRYIDLPNGDGGIVRKPRALGDRSILDFLRDWLGILGVEIGFEHGGFVARRYDPLLPPVLELHAGNLCLPITLDSPKTLDANVTGVVSVSFTREEATGERTEEVSTITTGPYAINTKDGPLPETQQVISELTTKTTYRGSLDVLTVQVEKGWYARREAGEIFQSDGAGGYEIVPRVAGGGYAWVDGTNRRNTQERFEEIRRSIRRKTTDESGNVISTREERFFPHFVRRAFWQIVSGVDELVNGPSTEVYVSDDGQGLLYSGEVMGQDGQPDETDETVFTLSADGTIQQETRTELAYGIGAEHRRSEGAYGYGIDSRVYTSFAAEAFGRTKRVTTTRYRRINEDRYEAVQSVRVGNDPATTTTTQIIGALPRPERIEPTTSSQEIRAEVRDEQRIAFAGEEIAEVEHNEFVETGEEARALALWRAQIAGAIRLSCTIPIEGQVHKFRMVTVNLPGSSIDGLKFYVRSVQRNAATFRESITALHFPATLT